MAKMPSTDEERKKHLAESLWMNYFNRCLFEEGALTEMEYKQMVEKISQWSGKRSKGDAT